MNKTFDATVPYMEAGKCYNYTLNLTESPKQVMRFFVSNVQEHKLIGSGKTYNYSYWITTPNANSDVCDCGMYIWNKMGDFRHSDWYSVMNATIQEMTEEESVEFVKLLKSKYARKLYLGENNDQTC